MKQHAVLPLREIETSGPRSVAAAGPEGIPTRSLRRVVAGSVAQLLRENAALRQQVTELEGYRTLAYKDPLTGLWNRRYFDEWLTEEMDRTRRSGTRQLSIMMIDINDMKQINDCRGHADGDRALAAVAAYLRAHLRAYDLCCRIGGDEFAVILPEVGPEGCDTLTTRLRDKAPLEMLRGSVPFGLSLGVASLGPEVPSLEGLLRAADRSMYRDKRNQKTLRATTLD
jgi:diguanylate cyclase (GGDEF)-like protein